MSLQPIHILTKLFEQAWRKLAKQGKCDGVGGAQYRRMLAWYLADRYYTDPADYIIKWANLPPDAWQWKELN